MNCYDIVVCGGGFAGVSAAISAGRKGAKVLLIDANNCLGGAAGECLVNPFMPYYTKKDGKTLLLSDGLFTEINDLCFNAVFFKYFLRFRKRRIGTAVFVRAAVDQ